MVCVELRKVTHWVLFPHNWLHFRLLPRFFMIFFYFSFLPRIKREELLWMAKIGLAIFLLDSFWAHQFLWNGATLQQLFACYSQFCFMENTSYFFRFAFTFLSLFFVHPLFTQKFIFFSAKGPKYSLSKFKMIFTRLIAGLGVDFDLIGVKNTDSAIKLPSIHSRDFVSFNRFFFQSVIHVDVQPSIIKCIWLFRFSFACSVPLARIISFRYSFHSNQ